jgi:hypothetical protein
VLFVKLSTIVTRLKAGTGRGLLALIAPVAGRVAVRRSELIGAAAVHVIDVERRHGVQLPSHTAGGVEGLRQPEIVGQHQHLADAALGQIRIEALPAENGVDVGKEFQTLRILDDDGAANRHVLDGRVEPGPVARHVQTGAAPRSNMSSRVGVA